MKHLKLITFFCFSIFSLQAQIGINETEATPDASAMLDVASTSKGILVPRMTTAQRNAIASPATGLLIFDTSQGGFAYYNGTSWEKLSSEDASGFLGIGTDSPNFEVQINDAANANSWLQLTNSSTGSTANDGFIIGNNDHHAYIIQRENLPLGLKTNNTTRMTIDGSGNVGINTTTPQAVLDVDGTAVLGGRANDVHSTIGGYEGVIMPGVNSDYIIAVQDGNGRIQHKWNATYSSDKFIKAGEDASTINWIAQADNSNWMEFKFADGSAATAGSSIPWSTHLAIKDNGNVGIGDSDPDSKLEVNGAVECTELKSKDVNDTDKEIRVNGHSWINFRTGGSGAVDRSGAIFSRYNGSHFFVSNESEKLRIGYSNENVTNPQFANSTGLFNLTNTGSLTISGTLTQNSDRNLKKDFAKISSPLEKLNQLNGYYYNWKDTSKKGRQVGVVAQEVEAVLPELISIDENGTRSVAYGNLTALLIEVNKQQELEKEELKTELAELSETVAKLTNQNQQLVQQVEEVAMLKAALLKIEARLGNASIKENTNGIGDE